MYSPITNHNDYMFKTVAFNTIAPGKKIILVSYKIKVGF